MRHLLDLFRRPITAPPVHCANAWACCSAKRSSPPPSASKGTAWAGIFLIDPTLPPKTPRTAIWQTRAEARDAAAKLRTSWPKARPVRLRITIAVA